MKQWVEGDWHGKWNDGFSSTLEHNSDYCAVDVFKFLKTLPKIEKKHGEIRKIKVGWYHHPSHGTGQDYDPGYYEYHIEFERLETDEEEARREKSEARELVAKEKEAMARQKEEKALLKELLAKYGGK